MPSRWRKLLPRQIGGIRKDSWHFECAHQNFPQTCFCSSLRKIPTFSRAGELLATFAAVPFVWRSQQLVLVSSEVRTAALRAGFAVDVRVDVFLQVRNDIRGHSWQRAGIDAPIVCRAERKQRQSSSEQRRRERGCVLAQGKRIKERGTEKQWIGLDQLRRIGIAKVIGTAD